MLTEKLADAQTRRQRQVVWLVLGGVGLLVLVVVFVVLVPQQNQHQQAQEQQAPARQVQARQEHTQAPAPPSPEETALRARFKARLASYEDTTEAVLNGVAPEVWAAGEQARLAGLKTEGISAFSRGDYGAANAAMDRLEDMATNLLADREQGFAQSHQRAQQAWAQDQHSQAQQAIERALALKPASQEAQALQARIAALGKVAPLLEAAAVARAENDGARELELLEQILAFAPGRTRDAARAEELRTFMREQDLRTTIKAGFEALQQRQPQRVRAALERLRILAPQRQELAQMAQQLQALESALRLESALEQAQTAMAADRWEDALLALTAASQEAPHNQNILADTRVAQQIVRWQRMFQRHLDQPYRLSDDGVRTRAMAERAQASQLASRSPSLDKALRAWDRLLPQFARTIPVHVTSDGATRIVVRGVGKVGAVTHKTIQLKPGDYTFEGLREGYKAKLMTVRIPYDHDSFSITVICDERI